MLTQIRTHPVSRVCRDPVTAAYCCTTVCFLFSTPGAAADELINVTINVPVNWNMTHCSDLGFCNPVNIYTCVHFQAPSYVFPDSMQVTRCLSHPLSSSKDGVSMFSWVLLSFHCRLPSDTVLYITVLSGLLWPTYGRCPLYTLSFRSTSPRHLLITAPMVLTPCLFLCHSSICCSTIVVVS